MLDELGYVPGQQAGGRAALRRYQHRLRTHQSDRHYQLALRELGRGARLRTAHRRHARSPHPPLPYPGVQRPQLSPRRRQTATTTEVGRADHATGGTLLYIARLSARRLKPSPRPPSQGGTGSAGSPLNPLLGLLPLHRRRPFAAPPQLFLARSQPVIPPRQPSPPLLSSPHQRCTFHPPGAAIFNRRLDQWQSSPQTPLRGGTGSAGSPTPPPGASSPPPKRPAAPP